jgi:hypothetical protein
MLGNSPRTQTPIVCERAKSFSLGLWFLNRHDLPYDITDCGLSFVMRQQARYGGAEVIEEQFGLVNATEGYARLDLQAADLNLAPRAYEYVVTLLTPENYSLVVLEGNLEVSDNPESTWVATEYGGLVPGTSLTVKLGRQNRVNVKVGMPVNITMDIGTVSTLDTGETATASISGTVPTLYLNLGLPRGAAGAPGAAGSDGADGAPGAAGSDGADGGPGTPGTDGVDGTDGADGDDGIPTGITYWGQGSEDSGYDTPGWAMKIIGENRVTVSTQDADTNDVGDHLDQLVGRGGIMYMSEMDGAFWMMAPYSNVTEDGGHYNFALFEALPRTFPDFQFKMVFIPAGQDGFDGDDGTPIRPRHTLVGSPHSFVYADNQAFCCTTSSSPVTITVLNDSTIAWDADTVLNGCQLGTGQVEIVAGSGVTLHAADGLFVADQYGVFEIRKVDANEWIVYGRMTP